MWLVVTDIRSKALGWLQIAVTKQTSRLKHLHYKHVTCCDTFSSSSVVSHTFSALCMYSEFGHHPHPQGYPCAKFFFFRSLHCWASEWRKSRTHLIIHCLFDAPGTEVKTSFISSRVNNALSSKSRPKPRASAYDYWQQHIYYANMTALHICRCKTATDTCLINCKQLLHTSCLTAIHFYFTAGTVSATIITRLCKKGTNSS